MLHIVVVGKLTARPLEGRVFFLSARSPVANCSFLGCLMWLKSISPIISPRIYSLSLCLSRPISIS